MKTKSRHLKNSEISLEDAEAAIDNEIFWTVPNDYGTTLSAINQGKILAQIAPNAHITENLRRLAYSLNGGNIIGEKRLGGFLKGWHFKKNK